MNFSEALLNIKDGVRVQRSGWNGTGMWVSIVDGSEWATAIWNSNIPAKTLPFIVMYTAQGDYVPWLASQTDILADDWLVFTDESRINEIEDAIHKL